MPRDATEARARQMSALAGVIHEKSRDPRIGQWLDRLERDDSLELFDQANIREARRDYDRQVKVPTELVVALLLTPLFLPSLMTWAHLGYIQPILILLSLTGRNMVSRFTLSPAITVTSLKIVKPEMKKLRQQIDFTVLHIKPLQLLVVATKRSVLSKP